MNDDTKKLEEALRNSFVKIEKLRDQISELENLRNEPVAIIGMSCRLPGNVNSPEEFWNLLIENKDAIIDIPSDRWNTDEYYDSDKEAPGKMYVKKGGFLQTPVDEFDANFFHISPREAEDMDPQQRVALEVAYQAIQSAGINPADLMKTPTGVYMGICFNDYGHLITGSGHIEAVSSYYSTGNHYSVLSGRIAYFFGLQGPAISIDTACSSSLVTIDAAVKDLRLKRCNLALAGGVNLMLAPEPTINFCKSGMLSPEGYCKTFDEDADGYVRGEGCGIIVLKRLSDAMSDNNTILAVIRGTAVNQDGASSGLTVPNGLAQEQVIQLALENAKVSPLEVGYIEAHGTGTALGDPIELEALKNSYAQERTQDHPIYVGSVKTNIGHLEGAAGVASVIKVVLSFLHEKIPATLHFKKLNPNVDLSHSALHIASSNIDWKRGQKRLAGISSFGFSGTNAHLILEEGPKLTEKEFSELRLGNLQYFERKRYWIEGAAATLHSPLPVHPLLGVHQTLPDDVVHFTNHIGLQRLPYLVDHQVFDEVAMPAAAFLEMTIAAVYHSIASPEQGVSVDDMSIEAALILNAKKKTRLEVIVSPQNQSDSFSIKVASERSVNPSRWQIHTTAGVSILKKKENLIMDVEAIRKRCAEKAVSLFYQNIDASAIHYGPAFRGLEEYWLGDREVLGKVKLKGLSIKDYFLHPALLDSCFQLSVALKLSSASEEEAQVVYLPTGIEHLEFFDALGEEVWVHLRASDTAGSSIQEKQLWYDMDIMKSTGEVLVRIQGFTVKRTDKSVFMKIIAKEQGILNLMYQVEWEPLSSLYSLSPPQTVEYMPALHELQTSMKARELSLFEKFQKNNRNELNEALRKVSLHYIVKALEKLGFNALLNQHQLKTDLLGKLKINPLYYLLMERYWQMLAEAEFITQNEKQITVLSNWSAEPIDIQALSEQYTDIRIELELMRRNGEVLDKILQGREDPLSLLFSEERGISAEHMYRDTPSAKVFNTLLSETLSTLLQARPTDQILRILEIGAGTGGTTAHVLPVLPEQNIYYVFSDVSDLFLNKAEQRFKDYSFLSYRLFNVEQDPKEQGFMPGKFDIILASNVLHATKNIQQTMQHVQELLSPGGVALVYELTSPSPQLDLTFGLAEGWWRFEDNVRKNYPLLMPEEWKKLLEKLGYAEMECISDDILPEIKKATQAIILAKAPKEKIISKEQVSPIWVVMGYDLPTTQNFLSHLHAQGEDYLWLEPGFEFYELEKNHIQINPLALKDTEEWLNSIALHLDLNKLRGVVNLMSLLEENSNHSRESLIHYEHVNCQLILNTIKAWQSLAKKPPLRYYLILSNTQGNIVDKDVNSTIPAWGGTLWGMGKVMNLELSGDNFSCICVDLDPKRDAKENAIAIYTELYSSDNEDQIVHRASQRYGLRINYLSEPKQRLAEIFNPEGTFLITGGLTGLGLLFAEHLANLGVKHLMLMARSLPTEEAQSAIQKLISQGVEVNTFQGDVSTKEAIDAVFEAINNSMPSLKGVIHSAGIVDDALLVNQSWEKYNHVFGPKVYGAWYLHQATVSMALNYFVVFSSIAGLFGSTGQSNHSAANAFLDSLMYQRRAMNLPALSINWGTWGEIGYAARKGEQLKKMPGVDLLAPEKGLLAFDIALASGKTQIAVSPMRWPIIFEEQTKVFAWQKRIAQIAALRKATLKGDRHNLLEKVISAAPEERQNIIEGYIRILAADILKSDVADVGDKNFFDLGMDSLMTVELRNRLQAAFGEKYRLSTTVIFDYTNIKLLANFLNTAVIPGSQPVTETKIEENLEEEIDKLSDEEAIKELERKLGES